MAPMGPWGKESGRRHQKDILENRSAYKNPISQGGVLLYLEARPIMMNASSRTRPLPGT